MNRAEFINEIEDVLEEERGTYNGTENLAEVAFDSITLMSFITMVSSKLDVTLSPSRVAECETVNDLVELVNEKLES